MLTSEMLSMLSTCTSMPTGMAAPETTAETSHNHDCSSNRRRAGRLCTHVTVRSTSPDTIVCLRHTHHLISSFSLFKPERPKEENRPSEHQPQLPTIISCTRKKKSNKNTGCLCGQAGFHYFRPLFFLKPTKFRKDFSEKWKHLLYLGDWKEFSPI